MRVLDTVEVVRGRHLRAPLKRSCRHTVTSAGKRLNLLEDTPSSTLGHSHAVGRENCNLLFHRVRENSRYPIKLKAVVELLAWERKIRILGRESSLLYATRCPLDLVLRRNVSALARALCSFAFVLLLFNEVMELVQANPNWPTTQPCRAKNGQGNAGWFEAVIFEVIYIDQLRSTSAAFIPRSRDIPHWRVNVARILETQSDGCDAKHPLCTAAT